MSQLNKREEVALRILSDLIQVDKGQSVGSAEIGNTIELAIVLADEFLIAVKSDDEDWRKGPDISKLRYNDKDKA